MKSIKSDRNTAKVYIQHPFEGSSGPELNLPLPSSSPAKLYTILQWIFHRYFPEEQGWAAPGPGWFGKLSNVSAASLNFPLPSVSFQSWKLERQKGGLGMTLFFTSKAQWFGFSSLLSRLILVWQCYYYSWLKNGVSIARQVLQFQIGITVPNVDRKPVTVTAL